MTHQREKWIAGGILLVFLVLITFPYLVAQSASDETRIFGGFLLNPIDGNSYLAKMRQGYEGSWLFKLPYTAQPGEGAALNLYYLFLGHVSRWMGWSLIFTFHAGRVAGALLLCLALYGFFRRMFEESAARLIALALALFGSGLGWLAAGFGLFTSDFWVAEAYPFLASFANAHFPLGLALQVWLVAPLAQGQSIGPRLATGTLAVAALLSMIYPFGWVVAAAVSAAWVAWLAWKRMAWKAEGLRWACLVVGGAPYVAYSLWIVNAHPVLAQWNAQNLTPAPGVMDLVISLSPALVLAIFGTLVILRKKGARALSMLGIWMIVGVVILYLPFSLQRRLISGLFIPVAGLAVFAWQQFQSISRRHWLAAALLLLSLPTNALIILSGVQAAREQDTAVYVFGDELAAFHWLDEHAARDSLVMAAPDSGLLIPAYSSARVQYGHPFETVDAAARLAEGSAFFSGGMDESEATEMMSAKGVDYVLYGPREQALGELPVLDRWQIVFKQGEVQIWAPGN
ncbi:MAG: hypothetical protein M1347_02545 [Chloroflexi bacterium]|nr:hypothetical protein [Chloroflexota bacterium]